MVLATLVPYLLQLFMREVTWAAQIHILAPRFVFLNLR